jgi:hypothetical protein
MVHEDHHIEIARAIYSVPTAFVGCRVHVRADSHLVKVFFKGQLIKVHPRKEPGQRSTDPDDYPEDRRACVMWDLDNLVRVATSHRRSIGAYTTRLLDNPLPWTKVPPGLPLARARAQRGLPVIPKSSRKEPRLLRPNRPYWDGTLPP